MIVWGMAGWVRFEIFTDMGNAVMSKDHPKRPFFTKVLTFTSGADCLGLDWHAIYFSE